jgi:hypothetical protein
MTQLGEQPDLPKEALALLLGDSGQMQQLKGDRLTGVVIGGPIYGAHATLTGDFFNDKAMIDYSARSQFVVHCVAPTDRIR